MKEFSRRSSVTFAIGAALAILAGKAIGPYALIVSLILLLGLAFRVEWFVSMLLAFWVLLSAPLLTALGESEAGQDRLAILVLIFMTLGLVRLIAEVRGAAKSRVRSEGADRPPSSGPSSNGEASSE
jgi:hypothetical protein